MASIEDRWYRRVNGRLVPTDRKDRGLRWRARWIDPEGRERGRSFSRKTDAEKFLTEIEHSKIKGTYLDPDAGRITLRARVPHWLATRTCGPTTRASIEKRVTKHLLSSNLADKRLNQIAPSMVSAWVAGLPVGASYTQHLLADLSSILDQAVADSLIGRNPCLNATVRAPRVVRRKVVPWTREQVAAVRAGLPERYRAMVDAGAGCGLRQGEIFGLALSEIDFLRRVIHLQLQVALDLGVHPVFAPPKAGKQRDVPLPQSVALALAAHIEKFPPRAVTLPWRTRDGRPRTEQLLFTGIKGGAVAKDVFNRTAWRPARRGARIPEGREAGMHQLRHHYASVLLRGGIDVRRLSEYLGHHSPSITLNTYSHLIPDDEERSLREIEQALQAPADESGPAAEGQA